MTISMALDRTEFASKRRTAFDDAEKVIAPGVKRALARFPQGKWFTPILDAAERVFRRSFREESGTNRHGDLIHAISAFRAELLKVLENTDDPREATAALVTRWVATAAVNAGTAFAGRVDSEDLSYEWVTMHDNHVRAAHKAADGQTRGEGKSFTVGGEQLRYPGDPRASLKLWINCRCALRPALASESSMTAAAAAPDDDPGMVVVALPHPDHEINQISSEDAHTTMAYLGKRSSYNDEQISALNDSVAKIAGQHQPLTDRVSGTGTLGDDGAMVVFLDAQGLKPIRDSIEADPTLSAAINANEQYPTWIPHATLGYPETPPNSDTVPGDITYNRLALWSGPDQTEHPLGGDMTEPQVDPEAPPTDAAEELIDPTELIPWHSVLAPMDTASGDGREFVMGGMSHRDLPLPLTWQRVSSDGHSGSVIVGRIDDIFVEDNLIKGSGVFLNTPETDEMMGLIAEGALRGVSVDIDDAEFDLDENANLVRFSEYRICSACVVGIPAYAEAYIAFGPWDDVSLTAADCACDMVEVTDEEMALFESEFKRGPGWITNPVATRRIHDYWTDGEGAKKVGWGTPGSYNRCRTLIGKEIAEHSPDKTRFLNQICAQWYHDATGIWPGKKRGDLGKGKAAAAVSLVASASRYALPQRSWFSNPNLPCLSPLTVMEPDESGLRRVLGHLADWTSCHTQFPGMCRTTPHSMSNYASFHLGVTTTDEGDVATGKITVGGGHADGRLGLIPALSHYDDVSSVACDVVCGEDEFGVWFSGWVRPWTTDRQIIELKAAPPSGDWREVGGNLELCIAHSVNNPGFPVPRIGVVNGHQVSIIAAGYVPPAGPEWDAKRALAEGVAELNRRELQSLVDQLPEGV